MFWRVLVEMEDDGGGRFGGRLWDWALGAGESMRSVGVEEEAYC